MAHVLSPGVGGSPVSRALYAEGRASARRRLREPRNAPLFLFTSSRSGTPTLGRAASAMRVRVTSWIEPCTQAIGLERTVFRHAVLPATAAICAATGGREAKPGRPKGLKNPRDQTMNVLLM